MAQRWVGEQFQTCKSHFFVIMRYNECARVGIKTFRSYLSSDNAASEGHCLKHFVLYAGAGKHRRHYNRGRAVARRQIFDKSFD